MQESVIFDIKLTLILVLAVLLQMNCHYSLPVKQLPSQQKYKIILPSDRGTHTHEFREWL